MILRELGYSGFIDNDLGVIHSNEPTQAFFLSSKNFELVETIINDEGESSPLYYQKMKKVPEELKQLQRMVKKDSMSPMARALKLKDSDYKYQLDLLTIPDDVKAILPALRIPVDSLSDDSFKELIDESGYYSSEYMKYIKNINIDQYQYALDSGINIPITMDVVMKIDKLKFKPEHYDQISRSTYISWEKKWRILGDSFFEEPYIGNILDRVTGEEAHRIAIMMDDDTVVKLLRTITGKVFNSGLSEFDPLFIKKVEKAFEEYDGDKTSNFEVLSDKTSKDIIKTHIDYFKKRAK